MGRGLPPPSCRTCSAHTQQGPALGRASSGFRSQRSTALGGAARLIGVPARLSLDDLTHLFGDPDHHRCCPASCTGGVPRYVRNRTICEAGRVVLSSSPIAAAPLRWRVQKRLASLSASDSSGHTRISLTSRCSTAKQPHGSHQKDVIKTEGAFLVRARPNRRAPSRSSRLSPQSLSGGAFREDRKPHWRLR